MWTPQQVIDELSREDDGAEFLACHVFSERACVTLSKSVGGMFAVDRRRMCNGRWSYVVGSSAYYPVASAATADYMGRIAEMEELRSELQ